MRCSFGFVVFSAVMMILTTDLTAQSGSQAETALKRDARTHLSPEARRREARRSVARAGAVCGDVDGDGHTGFDDLAELLSAWGSGQNASDLDDSGLVGFGDLSILLLCWNGPDLDGTFSPIGIGVSEMRDWSAIVFANAVRQSRHDWFSQAADFSGPFDSGVAEQMVDEHGWPNVTIPHDPDGAGPLPPQLLQTLLLRDLYAGNDGLFPPVASEDAERFPAGDYIVTYEGEGKISLAAEADVVIYDTPGPHVFTVKQAANNGIILKIRESSSSDPVRNVRVMLPGYSLDESVNPWGPFYGPFVERLRGFASVRFMAWSEANEHPCSNNEDPQDSDCLMEWDDRATIDDRTQSSRRGVALEYMIELANQTEVDPWFVVPHAVTDEYIENMAEMIVADLDPERKIYVEYSNEVWNPIYNAFHYVDEKSAEDLPGYPHPANGFYARRTGEINCIFKNELQAQGHSTSRLVTIVSGWLNNPTISERNVEGWFDSDANPNPCNATLDALAVNAYFAPDDDFTPDEDVTLNELFDLYEMEINEGRYSTRTEQNKLIVDDYNIDLIAYEGGQHLIEPSPHSPLADTFAEANRDPRMKDVYIHAAQKWAEITDSGLYVYFSFTTRYSRLNNFGHLEYTDQPLYMFDADGLRAFKMEALREIIDAQ